MKVLAFLVLIPIVCGLGGQHLLGAPEDTNANDKTVADMAAFAVDQINAQDSNSATPRKLVEIVSAKTQVVAGVNYIFVLRVEKDGSDEICDAKVYYVVWEKPPKKELTSYKCRKAEQPNDVQDAVKFATQKYNAESNRIFRVGPQSLSNVKKLELAENKKLYTFTVSFVQTNCFNDGTKQDECAVNSGSEPVETCTYEVLYLKGQNPPYKIQSKQCSNQPQSPPLNLDQFEKVKGLLKEHNKLQLGDLMMPSDVVPLLGKAAKEPSNHISPVLKRKKRSVDNLQPLLQHIGNSLLDAFNKAKKEQGEKSAESQKIDFSKLFGQDGHDLVKHGISELLGGDDHDLQKHGIDKLLGGDGHDLQKHDFQKLLGRDGHDLLKHGLGQLLGGDGHDYKNHGELIGGGDHDYKNHGKLIGGGDHDYKNHGKLIGGGDHDYKKHGGLIGGGDHDYKKHGGLIGGGDHDYKKHGGLIGGDDHDYQKHGKLIGGGDHDYKKHGKLIGGDDHDYKPHSPPHSGNVGDVALLGQFKEFMIKYGKVYRSHEEEKKRFSIFCENMEFARKLNATEQGTAVYGATKFADLTQEEFRQKYLGKKWDDFPSSGASKMGRAKIPRGTPPKSFDWRKKGAVTPVKNQGSCGSCWAFSTTGNIEGQWKIKRNKLVSLSEQELVDCDNLDEGCNGGLPSNAYMAIMKLGGLESESEYKYRAEDEKCVFNRSEVVVKINGAVNISSDENEMAAWLAEHGPISIGINAMAMQFYFGGISHPWKIFCDPSSLDHGVLIVGYGVRDGEPYWIIKNSWGENWGEEGYYLVYRGSGVCGLNRMCTSAVVN